MDACPSGEIRFGYNPTSLTMTAMACLDIIEDDDDDNGRLWTDTNDFLPVG